MKNMAIFEFKNEENSIAISVVENTSADLVAYTEFDFIKYESEPVEFSMEKFKKIHARIQYKLIINKDIIVLSYVDELFDFNLTFNMKKEHMDPEGESSMKIKKASFQIKELMSSVEDLQKRLYFGLKIEDTRISFEYSIENGLYMTKPHPRFEELLRLMTFPGYNGESKSLPKWTDTYPNISKAMSDSKNHRSVVKGRYYYQNILYSIRDFIGTFCCGLMSFHQFTAPDHDSGEPYRNALLSSGKSSILIAEIRILAFPPYSVIPYGNNVEKKEYYNYKIDKRILIGDIWKGYCVEYNINDSVLLWNHQV